MFKSAALVLLVLFVAPVVSEDAVWADSETTTKLWQAISSADMEKLKSILDEDETAATARASDGRGPLFWAYEYKNDEAIALLKEAGADENSKDADGKTCTQLENAGEATEFMKAKQVIRNNTVNICKYIHAANSLCQCRRKRLPPSRSSLSNKQQQ
jgi:hypothetical protein